ncbi:DMT family transporter [Achromobacter sp.]|uniref:DMT family transporter n=1 Tax=Achromobacter sp. TaxID=134375 RepID=UPI0028A05DFB|nr:DMT family transporter [Achromobacter sp.]
MRTGRTAIAAAATVGMLVGAAMVSTSVVSSAVSPATLAFLRYLIGAAVLLLPLGPAVRTTFMAKDAVAIATLGVFQFAVLVLLLNHALLTVSATVCALVFATMPLVTMCLAVITGKEPYSGRGLLGVCTAVAGVAYLLLSPSASAAGVAPNRWGMVALVSATIVGAVTSILYGPYLRRYPALATCRLAMVSAVVFLLGFCALTSQPLIPSLNRLQWANVVFIGLSSGVGYFCWLWALGRLAASKVTAFQALGPVTAALIESLLSQRLAPMTVLVTLAMVCAGLVVATRRPDAN